MKRGKTPGGEQPSDEPRSGASRPFKRFLRARSGATAIEFGILAVPFLFVMFATVETGLAFMAQLTLDGGVENVSRLVRTGQLDAEQLKPETFRKLVCEKVDVFLSCEKLTIDLRSYASFEDVDLTQPSEDKANSTSTQPGSAKTIMALRVYYPWTSVTDVLKLMASESKTITLASVTAFRTEPY